MVAKYLKSFCFCALLAGAGLSFAQEDDLQQETSPLDRFRWQTSGKGTLGFQATIDIPEGYRFLDEFDVLSLFKELEGEVPLIRPEGIITPDDYQWLALFAFIPDGYVNDSEKNDLNSDELLNRIKAKKNFELIRANTITGWLTEPSYNSDTNVLEWAVTLVNSKTGGHGVLFMTQVLGRNGHMNIGLTCELKDFEEVLPEFKKAIAGFEYNSGKSYAEFQKGDKRAKYGLKGVVAGEAFHYDEQPKYLTFLKENVAYIIAGIIVIIAAVAAGLFIIRQTSNT